MLDRPAVTVIVLNLNGLEHLDPCFKSLKALDYPADQLRLHLVDNGSSDGSAQFMMREHPDVKLTAHAANLGFSEAVNLAVEEADTPFVAFLNNDTRVDAAWLSTLIDPLVRGDLDCAGSRIIDWGGRQDLFEGGGCNFHGIGFQAGLHDAADGGEQPANDTIIPVLFACGAALAMQRSLFLDVGGFDVDYFAYYEDVDLGWRLWALGYTVGLVPASIVHHHHSATAARVPIHKLRVLHIRNPILTILKNYEDDTLLKALPAAYMLTVKRMSFLANLDHNEFRIGNETAGAPRPRKRRWWNAKSRNAGESITVPKVVMSDLVAVEDVNRLLPKFLAKRADIQARRKRADREIIPLFRDPYWLAESAEPYAQLHETLVEFFGLDDVFKTDAPVPSLSDRAPGRTQGSPRS